MSDLQLKTKSTLKEEQLSFLSKEVLSFTEIDTEDEALFQEAVRMTLNAYQSDSQPLFSPIPASRHQLPWREETELNFRQAIADVRILQKEQDSLGSFLVDAFNTVYSEKERLLQRVASLNNLTGDLNLLAGNDSNLTTYIKESFQNSAAMDESAMVDGVQRATISTQEGVLTLGRTHAIDHSEKSRIAHISGNGTPGGNQLARKILVKNRTKEEEKFHFLSELDPTYHKVPEAILDNRPDTVFEYERANVPDAFKAARRNYDFEWAESKETGDHLRLRLIVQLEDLKPINWFSLVPYYPYGSTGRMIIHSLKTSEDGFEYTPLYLNHSVLNQSLTESPQSYQLDELFSGNTDPALANYTGQGVWVFPERLARYVEVVLDQDQSYPELLGQAVYTIKKNEQATPVLIPAPEELKNAAPGEYLRTVDGERVTYTKQIDTTQSGWRYAIGLRDVHIMQYQYAEKSLFVSKRYEVEGEIKKLMLYANEIIPPSYQDVIPTLNDWIVYEVSFDDSNWIRVSPSHHEPVNDNFPPKILELNQTAVDLTSAFHVHKETVRTQDSSRFIRFRVTLSRPKGDEFIGTTPVLEDIALKIERREGGLA